MVIVTIAFPKAFDLLHFYKINVFYVFPERPVVGGCDVLVECPGLQDGPESNKYFNLLEQIN